MALPDVSGHNTIEPIGEVYICKSVPLDSTYTHSLNVDQLQNGLQSAITSYSKYHLIGQTFTRITKNTMRVEITANDLQECNYMMIRNGDFFGNNNKWYYCFIENKEYINNQTTDITFKVDYLLTYWYDFTIPRNFIEREHCAVADDVVGKNLIPENIELGDLIIQRDVKTGIFYLKNRKYAVIMYVPNLDAEKPYVQINGGMAELVANLTDNTQFVPLARNQYAGVICCLAIPFNSVFDVPTIQMAINLINSAEGSIVRVFEITGEIYDDNFLQTTVIERNFTINEQTSFKRLNSNTLYPPKNKKLLNYPYKRLIVSNNNGSTQEYKWELFSGRVNGGSQAVFSYFNALLPDVKCYTYPTHYRGYTNDYESGIVLDNFPMPSWTEDSYTKWWAQNKSNFGISLASQAIMTGLTLGTGMMRGSPQSMAYSAGFGALGIGRALAQERQAKATPDTAHVQDNSPIIQLLQDRLGFTFYDVGITGEMAKVIDDYFELYGYACHEEKIPNFAIPNARRKFWNYCKMQNAQIEAQTGTGRGLPQEAQKAIEEVFNNGITLWSDIAQIGNYNNDNHN